MIKITLIEMVSQKICKLIIIRISWHKISLTQLEWILAIMELASKIRRISFLISINIHKSWIITISKVLIQTITFKINIFKMSSSIKYNSGPYKDQAPPIIHNHKISKLIKIKAIVHYHKIILNLHIKTIFFKILWTQDIK